MPELTLEQVVDQHMPDVVAAVPVPETPAEPIAAATPDPVATPVATPASVPADLSDDTPVTVTIDGVPTVVTLKEARAGYSRHAASTQRFQDAAKRREEADALHAQAQQAIADAQALRDKITNIIRDPAKLSALYMASQAQAQPAATTPAPAPTLADVMRLAEERATAVVQDKLSAVARAEQQAVVSRDLTDFTTGLVKDEPVLAKFLSRGLDEHIFAKVMSMKPKDIPQAKEWIAAEIDQYRADVSAELGTTQKATAVAKAAAASATERGGNPVAPAATTYTGFDDPRREADMIAYLNTLQA